MKKHLILASALALAVISPAAMAVDGGAGFVRAEVGQSDVQLDYAGFSESETDTSATFGGGYWFNRYFAVEGHIGTLYTEYLGYDTDLDLVSMGVGVAVKRNFGADGHGFFVGGRTGVARLTAQVREDDWDVVDDAHSTKAYFGASVGYDFNRRWGVSLNWDRRQADFEGVDVDVDTIAIGGEFRF
ncbi:MULTISPECIES: outer membrane beta-barrel protein [unclassified Luteimonas]|uniref:outer membrane beta-barrel protein n=1 Tax=unclassified Luteimonas TaxID=2629088 RepID=UPI0016049546|nr:MULTISPECIES: outer membrane beta-barrel protein [unclassified Luteimonas]MBB1472445.1 outer membrane beta-barrel protein [Luteimonas sp. MC1782]MBB6598843.1 outer membrane beta-barrel protein [Luteimonas sp. MC1825]QOC88995.1 outer membrane beta-barrel protein [Luteimonas sp. MC1825]